MEIDLYVIVMLFPQDGTDLAHGQGQNWQQHVFHNTIVEHMLLFGWMALILHFPKGKLRGQPALIFKFGYHIVVFLHVKSRSWTVDIITSTN
jgi:hypothetical protein